MERNKELKKLYEKITEVKTAAPIRTNREKAIFERMVHNQVKWLNEETLAGDLDFLGQILVPVLRRAFPQMIGKDIVGVQPMNQPVGYAFALRHHYANDEAAGNIVGGLESKDSKQGSLRTRPTPNSLVIFLSGSDHGFSIGDSTSKGDEIVFIEDNKLLIKLTASGSEKADYVVGDAEGDTPNTIINVFDNEAGFQFIFSNYSGPFSTAVAEQKDKDIKELGISIDRLAIEAVERTLRATYTLESAQDLKNIHGRDMATELIDILTYEITQAIDRNIIDKINEVAVKSSFDLKVAADGRWQAEKFRTAYIQLVRVSNTIAKRTLRGPGNFIVAAPDVVTMVEQLPQFQGAPIFGDVDSSEPVSNLGQSFVGNVGGRFKVYRDNFAVTDFGTVGFKGTSSYDAGVIWSPYTPIQMIKTTKDNGNPIIIFKERSAISESIWGASNYYQQILFNNIFTSK